MHTLAETADTWFRYVEMEFQDLCVVLEAREVTGGLRALKRMIRVLRQLLMMRRLALNDADGITRDPGLGRDVVGLRRLELAVDGRAWAAYVGMLSHFGLRASDLYGPHCADAELYQLSERLVEFDRLLRTWLELLGPGEAGDERDGMRSFRDRLRAELEYDHELEARLDTSPGDEEALEIGAALDPPHETPRPRRQRAGTAPMCGAPGSGRGFGRAPTGGS